jgi:hypothetical protein
MARIAATPGRLGGRRAAAWRNKGIRSAARRAAVPPCRRAAVPPCRASPGPTPGEPEAGRAAVPGTPPAQGSHRPAQEPGPARLRGPPSPRKSQRPCGLPVRMALLSEGGRLLRMSLLSAATELERAVPRSQGAVPRRGPLQAPRRGPLQVPRRGPLQVPRRRRRCIGHTWRAGARIAARALGPARANAPGMARADAPGMARAPAPGARQHCSTRAHVRCSSCPRVAWWRGGVVASWRGGVVCSSCPRVLVSSGFLARAAGRCRNALELQQQHVTDATAPGHGSWPVCHPPFFRARLTPSRPCSCRQGRRRRRRAGAGGAHPARPVSPCARAFPSPLPPRSRGPDCRSAAHPSDSARGRARTAAGPRCGGTLCVGGFAAHG